MKKPAQADMIEIRYGQGATGGLGTTLARSHLTHDILKDMGVDNMPDSHLYIPAGIPKNDHRPRLAAARGPTAGHSGGVPIAIKLAASHFLERDLAKAVAAGVDALSSTAPREAPTIPPPSSSTISAGRPWLLLARAVRFLEQQQHTDIDLIISGGLRTPGDVLKALALGARAVYLGTPVLFAAVHDQIVDALPFEPPTELSYRRRTAGPSV